jgi:GDP-4-dehydro-6-deoxy-D-mannose reductase
VNVFGTLNVFEAASRLAHPCRVLNVSSAQVYAPSKFELTEISRIAPDNPYAASKAMAEFVTVPYSRSSKIDIVTVRSFNHAGPGQSPEFVVSSIAKQFAEIEAGSREPKLILGNTHVRRDFTDVRDVVNAYALLIEKGRANEIYNVCSGEARSIESIVEEFKSISEIDVSIESDHNKRRLGEHDAVWGSPAKLQAATGWKPEVPLRTTLQDVLTYWREQLQQNAASEISSKRLLVNR